MTPQRQLHIANALMAAGIAVLPVSMIWLAYTYTQSTGAGQVGDALLQLGAVYLLALLLSGGSAIWSVLVQRRHDGISVGGAGLLRVLVLVCFIAPLAVGIF